MGPVLLEVQGDRLSRWSPFLDTQTSFPLFDLPLQLA